MPEANVIEPTSSTRTKSSTPDILSGKVLVLFGGNSSASSVMASLANSGLAAINYDRADGLHKDILDDTIWHPLIRSIENVDFNSLYACPPPRPLELYGCVLLTDATDMEWENWAWLT